MAGLKVWVHGCDYHAIIHSTVPVLGIITFILLVINLSISTAVLIHVPLYIINPDGDYY